MNARVDRTVPKNDRGTRERVDQIDRNIGRAELVFVRVRNCARARGWQHSTHEKAAPAGQRLARRPRSDE